MLYSIKKYDIINLLIKQIDNLFGINSSEKEMLEASFEKVLERCEFCFSHSKNKYYSKDNKTYFNSFHSGQYSIFLYYYSNEIWKTQQNPLLSDKLYYLNKVLHSCDLFYEIELPSIFMLDHPVGSVMGRAKYSNYFSFGQNCTVGNNRGLYPNIGYNVRMCANSMIIGNCNIGDNVIIGAKACVKDQDIPNNCICFGESPNLIIKEKK